MNRQSTGKTATPTAETESLKRLRAMTRFAGPNDPIYKSGLTMVGVRTAKYRMPDGSELSQELREDDIVEALIRKGIPITRENWLEERFGLGREDDDRNDPEEIAWLDRNLPNGK